MVLMILANSTIPILRLAPPSKLIVSPILSGKVCFCLESLPKTQQGLNTQTVQTPLYTFYTSPWKIYDWQTNHAYFINNALAKRKDSSFPWSLTPLKLPLEPDATEASPGTCVVWFVLPLKLVLYPYLLTLPLKSCTIYCWAISAPYL